jgi:cytochrome c-type biogenesis protein CcmH
MRGKVFWVAGILAFILVFIPLIAIEAQEPTPSDDEVNAIAKQLYCPVCENIPLDVCPTKACDQWRGTIREKLSLGWDEAQIKQYFVDQYGDRVLSTPPPRGFNWLIYVLPPLAFVAGAGILFHVFRSWRETPQTVRTEPSKSQDASEDPYVRLLEEELRKRERAG